MEHSSVGGVAYNRHRGLHASIEPHNFFRCNWDCYICFVVTPYVKTAMWE